MKDIEQNFKDSLGNYELPYNAEAWSSLSSKLDSKMPVSEGTAPAASKLKWFIGSSSIIIVSIAAYFILFHDKTEASTKDNTITNNETAIDNDSDVRSNSKAEETREEVIVTNSNTSESVNIGSDRNESTSDRRNVVQENNRSNNSNDVANKNKSSEGTNIASNSEGNNTTNEQDNRTESGATIVSSGDGKLILPLVKDVCEGVVFEIDNTNQVDLIITGPEMPITIPANTVKSIHIDKEGNYILGAANGDQSGNVESFTVKRAPIADFTIDFETKFDKGLPTTNLSTDVIGEQFEWKFNKQMVTGRSAAAHFYTKGDQDIELTVTANNGCTATTTKSLYVDKKYNLMAENAFVPTDNDPRNSTFMPYALTVRDVNFTMIILDPTDGHMVYKTSDASKGWDGTDMKTGSPVAYEKSYIWKVVILNPEANEQNEYGGNIIPIRQK